MDSPSLLHSDISTSSTSILTLKISYFTMYRPLCGSDPTYSVTIYWPIWPPGIWANLFCHLWHWFQEGDLLWRLLWGAQEGEIAVIINILVFVQITPSRKTDQLQSSDLTKNPRNILTNLFWNKVLLTIDTAKHILVLYTTQRRLI